MATAKALVGLGRGFKAPIKRTLNRDLWRNFIDSLPNFIGSVRQPIRVNVYSYTCDLATSS